MTDEFTAEQHKRLIRMEATPAAPESWPGSLMREPFRKWIHAEVCDYIPDGGPTCDEIAEAGVAALADAWAASEKQS